MQGFPGLERIRYDLEMGTGDEPFSNPSVSVLSRPFEGEPVCPRLHHLELPQRVVSQSASATLLKSTLAERNARGRRLRRIGLTGDMWEGGAATLEPFQGLVDDVCQGP